jgi:hypothetical protein
LIDAQQQGKLGKHREHLAVRATQLQHGFATVGIIALVDEATGYQDFRQRDALAKILEKFAAKELRPWVKTFPSDFYRQIYRLQVFIDRLDREFPQWGTNFMLPFPEDYDPPQTKEAAN